MSSRAVTRQDLLDEIERLQALVRRQSHMIAELQILQARRTRGMP